jgi:hypothetical protein
MTNPMTRIHNTETGEIIDRPMTDEEYAVYLDGFKEPILTEEELAKAAKRQALLDKLGITEDEAKLLLGGN